MIAMTIFICSPFAVAGPRLFAPNRKARRNIWQDSNSVPVSVAAHQVFERKGFIRASAATPSQVQQN
jgi:hypothetical protein